jgi:hypothetical protein
MNAYDIVALQRDVVKLETRIARLEALVINETKSVRVPEQTQVQSGDFQTQVGAMQSGTPLSDESMS